MVDQEQENFRLRIVFIYIKIKLASRLLKCAAVIAYIIIVRVEQ